MSVVRTHRPVIRENLCGACGACRAACPAQVLGARPGEEDSLRSRVLDRFSFPSGGEEPLAVQPCRAACPLKQDVAGYLDAAARGNADLALEIILKDNPLPAVLGHLCPADCERACVRASIDEATAIREVKRLAAMQGRAALAAPLAGNAEVAIIGSGPAGLSAAAELSRLGIRSEIFEKEKEPGGLLGHAVPEASLAREALSRDIVRIQETGVVIWCGARVDARRIRELLKERKAVILATGAWKGDGLARLGVERSLRGAWEGLGLMSAIRRNPAMRHKGPAAVFGGGVEALASARALGSLGAKPVSLIFPWPAEMLSLGKDQILEAAKQGIKLHLGWTVTGVEKKRGALSGLRLAKVELGAPDGVGRRWPVGLKQAKTLPCTLFVAAWSRRSTAIEDLKGLGLEASWLGLVKIREGTLETNVPGLFAAGEAVSGPRSVVEAVAMGKKAARSIARYLQEASMRP